MASWYEMLKEAMMEDGEDLNSFVCTMDEVELKEDFDAGFGSTRGKPFTAWGAKWVYFPICYDGAEWVGHAPRNPSDIAMHHQGG